MDPTTAMTKTKKSTRKQPDRAAKKRKQPVRAAKKRKQRNSKFLDGIAVDEDDYDTIDSIYRWNFFEHFCINRFSKDKDNHVIGSDRNWDEIKIRKNDKHGRIWHLFLDLRYEGWELSSKSIETLPIEILANMTGLKELILVIDGIVPDSIAKLQNLTELRICRGRTLSWEWDLVATDILQLSGLKELRLLETSIESLPHWIGELKNLEELVLRENKYLSVLPKEIGDMTSLKVLDLGRSVFFEIPTSIGKLKNLEVLNLDHCDFLIELPEEIGDLISLTHLNIYWCWSLKSIPSSIGRLTNLKSLYLRPFDRKLLPAELGSLSSLEKLYIEDLEIDASSDNIWIWKLTKLRELHLPDLRITFLERGVRVHKYLLDIIQRRLPLLENLNFEEYGADYQDLGNIFDTGRKALSDAIAFNRIRRTVPNLWPSILCNAQKAFAGFRYGLVFKKRYEGINGTDLDCIYSLLTIGVESFANVLEGRHRN